MKSIRFHPDARIEMVESALFYEKQQQGLGKRYLESVQSAIHRIQLLPSSYQIIEKNIRRCRIDKFPFGVIFRERNECIDIIAVMHFKRNPDYWKTRTQ